MRRLDFIRGFLDFMGTGMEFWRREKTVLFTTIVTKKR